MHAWIQQPALVTSLAIALCAALTDLRWRIVPNSLVMAGWIAGMALQTWASGGTGALRALIGSAVGLAIFLPFYLLGGMGGGDVKLMAALGACLGPVQILRVALMAALLGAVLA